MTQRQHLLPKRREPALSSLVPLGLASKDVFDGSTEPLESLPVHEQQLGVRPCGDNACGARVLDFLHERELTKIVPNLVRHDHLCLLTLREDLPRLTLPLNDDEEL